MKTKSEIEQMLWQEIKENGLYVSAKNLPMADEIIDAVAFKLYNQYRVAVSHLIEDIGYINRKDNEK